LRLRKSVRYSDLIVDKSTSSVFFSKTISKHCHGKRSMCLAAPGRLQGWAAKLLLVRGESQDIEHLSLTANGTAIKGVCVNRRKHRPKCVTVGQKTVPVQGGYGACFCSHGRSLLVRAVSRYKFYRSREIITRYKTGCEHWSSVAVQTITEPEICHGARVKLQAAARVQMNGR
jgi:hypothetical protein